MVDLIIFSKQFAIIKTVYVFVKSKMGHATSNSVGLHNFNHAKVKFKIAIKMFLKK